MINGLIGLALLCLCIPYLWFQWGLVGTVPVLIVVLASLWFRGWVAVIWLIMAAVLVGRLEAEARHLLPEFWQHSEVPLSFCLSQPPLQYPRYQRLTARVTAQPEGLSLRRVRLSAKPEVMLAAGDCLTALVRLRQPLGPLIPGNFNVTRYYFSERIDALGTLVDVRAQRSDPGPVVRLYQRAEPHFDDHQVRAVWAALTLGWSSSMDAALADLFEQNQIKHLMVVSGMHIAMVAAWALLLAKLLHRIPGPWRGYWPQLRLVVVVSVCGLFVAITGFGFPALRAWLMLLAPLLALAMGGRLSGYQAMALAAVAIASLRPQAWLSTGAWLSFGLVWVLIRLHQRWQAEDLPNWQWALRFQLVLSVLSLPLSALLGFQWHPLSLLINMVVIPLVTVLILPWSLAILVCPTLAEWCYQAVVSSGIQLLGWIATWHQQAPLLAVAEIALWVALVGLLLTQWLNREQRWLAATLVALLCLWPGRYRPPEEFRLTLLDVGNGLALVLEWPEELWLYDTAGQWSDGTSIAEARLSGWYRRHRQQPDGVVVSHSDMDHAGGAAWATTHWPDAYRLSGEPEALDSISGRGGWRNCHRPTHLSSAFRLISTPVALHTNDNDHSCLLVVETSAGRLLITGDASRRVEYWLLQTHPELFPLSAVVIGHHGSQTASADAFLDASPQALLLVSAGDQVRPRWPNAELLSYLEQRQRTLYNSAHQGTLTLTARNGQWHLRDQRSAFRRRFLGS